MRIGWFGAAAMLGMALPATGGNRPPSDGITLTSSAWSNSPTRWTIHRDGSIDDERGARQPAISFPIDMVVRHTPAAPGRYAAIEGLLSPMRRLAGRKPDCRLQHSDDFYGSVTWPDGIRLEYDFGCDGPENRPVVDGVQAAKEQVGAWIGQAPVVRRYRITTAGEFDKP